MNRGRVVALIAVVASFTIVVAATDLAVWRIAVAVAFAAVVMRIGYAMISGLAQPTPEPPEAGQLRKVRLTYRCSICGAEVRMTSAASEEPEPPRHCLEDMDLVAPVME